MTAPSATPSSALAALLPLLGDPESHTPLALATAEQLLRLRELVRSGSARRRDGKPASEGFEAALLSENRNVAYLVESGIPNLLIDERLELPAPL